MNDTRNALLSWLSMREESLPKGVGIPSVK